MLMPRVEPMLPCFFGGLAERFGLLVFCVGLTALSAGVASGQNYPNKPIRIITAAYGGGGDVVARIIGQGLTAKLGQQVIVDNRAGSAVIPARIAAQAAPDGYTMLVAANSHWTLPLLKTVPYDPIRDYSPITLTTGSPVVLAVNPAVPANSVKDLIALAKARPGALNYGSGIDGAITHLAPELFKAMTGINVVRISYKGANPAIIALAQGEVQMMIVPLSSGMPFVRSGRIKALAVASEQPTALAPGLPTVAASGVPGYQSATLHAVFAPAKTPEALVKFLNKEIVRFINTPNIKEKFFAAGLDIIGSSPEQTLSTIKTEMSMLGKVIKNTGIRAN